MQRICEPQHKDKDTRDGKMCH